DARGRGAARRRGRDGRGLRRARRMIEIVLTREDANSESAFLAEWLVEDGEAVRKGRPVCVVETSKASIEIEAPGDGTIVQLVKAETEVELGSTIALVAANEEEVAAAEARRGGAEEAQP